MNWMVTLLTLLMVLFSLTPSHGCPEPAEKGMSCRCVVPTSLWCQVEYSFDQMPGFIPSDTVLDELVIGPRTAGQSGLVVEIQSNAFAGTTTKRLTIQFLEVERLDTGAFQALGDTLTKLELASNEIASMDEDAFLGVRDIYYLDLSGNRLRAITNRVFRGLSKLKTLYLQDNRITTITVNAFQDLQSLEVLHLGDNRMQKIGGEISNIPSLRYLYLNGNGGMNGLPLQFEQVAFFDMGKLKTLDVSRCALTRPPIEQMHFTKNVTKLNLSSNHIENLVFYAFAGVKHLKELYLNSNKLKWVPSSALQGLTELEMLDLKHNEINRVTNGAFKGMSALKSLDLSSNSIDSISGEPFAECHNLETLKFASNNIGTLEYRTFQCLSKLRKIVLNSNVFICDCDMAWFRNFSEKHKVHIVGNRICEYPMEYQAYDIMNFPTRYCPNARQNQECPKKTTPAPATHPTAASEKPVPEDDRSRQSVTSRGNATCYPSQFASVFKLVLLFVVVQLISRFRFSQHVHVS